MKRSTALAAFLILVAAAFNLRADDAKKENPEPSARRIRIEKLSPEDRQLVKPPDFVVYQTKYKKGTQIRFNHQTHAESYGLKCIECHHVEKCAHCHGTETTPMMVEESKIALHETCAGCHKNMGVGPKKCDDCHK